MSALINSEIFNFAPVMFQAVCDELLENGTVATTETEHAANKVRLQTACDAVIAQAEFNLNRDHRALWQDIWPRIVFAGTNNVRAASEIESMRALVPMFNDLDHFLPERYVFDEAEWRNYILQRKQFLQAPDGQHQIPAFEFILTTPEVWKILTKDSETYPNLRFSVMIPKVKKYLAVATHLHNHRAGGENNPLTYYMNGHQFSELHLFGQAWVEERNVLDEVRQRFEEQLGKMTALHTMMDMGLKTIKPDRVMTYLFSQLGWLKTLPASLTQEEVIRRYQRTEVIREMTVRADVFAASLDRAGFSRTHRRLDIWFVKYGQVPDKTFGLTVNLQQQGRGIRSIFDEVQHAAVPQDWWITPEQAAINWPTGEFGVLNLRASRPGPRTRSSHTRVCMSRD
jgi:hypothetical protein